MKLKDHGSGKRKNGKTLRPRRKEERYEETQDSGDSRAKANKNILKLTYGFALIVTMMAAYLGWFIGL